jgi:hypothetical protein
VTAQDEITEKVPDYVETRLAFRVWRYHPSIDLGSRFSTRRPLKARHTRQSARRRLDRG